MKKQELMMSREPRRTTVMDKNGKLISMGNGTSVSNGTGQATHPPAPDLIGSESLVGKDVYNQRGESLGEIIEIMLDMGSGRAVYAVLSPGTYFGPRTRLFAVPWNALRLDRQDKSFYLNVAGEQLRRAPAFDCEDWPDMADQVWANNIHSFYGTALTKEPQL